MFAFFCSSWIFFVCFHCCSFLRRSSTVSPRFRELGSKSLLLLGSKSKRLHFLLASFLSLHDHSINCWGVTPDFSSSETSVNFFICVCFAAKKISKNKQTTVWLRLLRKHWCCTNKCGSKTFRWERLFFLLLFLVPQKCSFCFKTRMKQVWHVCKLFCQFCIGIKVLGGFY